MPKDAIKRIEAALKAKSEMRGDDKFIIHSWHGSSGREELRVEDLKALLSAVTPSNYWVKIDEDSQDMAYSHLILADEKFRPLSDVWHHDLTLGWHRRIAAKFIPFDKPLNASYYFKLPQPPQQEREAV